MSAKSSSGRLVIGGAPRASLLPPEVAQSVKAKSMRRTLVGVVILSVLVVGAASGAAGLFVVTSQLALDGADQRTQALLAQQGEYAEVREISQTLELTKEARTLGTSTEINWKSYVASIQAILPAGTVVTNFSAETATPTTPFAQATAPLQGTRIGELTFTGNSASLPDVQVWLDALSGLKGFVDATPGSVTLVEESGMYTVSITMHINSEAYTNRFVVAPEEAATGDGTAPAVTEGTEG